MYSELGPTKRDHKRCTSAELLSVRSERGGEHEGEDEGKDLGSAKTSKMFFSGASCGFLWSLSGEQALPRCAHVDVDGQDEAWRFAALLLGKDGEEQETSDENDCLCTLR